MIRLHLGAIRLCVPQSQYGISHIVALLARSVSTTARQRKAAVTARLQEYRSRFLLVDPPTDGCHVLQQLLAHRRYKLCIVRSVHMYDQCTHVCLSMYNMAFVIIIMIILAVLNNVQHERASTLVTHSTALRNKKIITEDKKKNFTLHKVYSLLYLHPSGLSFVYSIHSLSLRTYSFLLHRVRTFVFCFKSYVAFINT